MAEKKPNKPGTVGTSIKKNKPSTKVKDKTKKYKLIFLDKYVKTGNITASCEAGNIGRRTFYNWMESDAKFKQEFEDAEDSLIDFAEGKLLKLIDEKNPTACIFFLKTKGKERGYIEPTYMNIQGSMKHSHTHKMNLKELKKSYDRLNGKDKKRS